MFLRKRRRRMDGSAGRFLLILFILMILAGVTALLLLFRSLLTSMAVSSANDAVILAVNGIVEDIMSDPDFYPEELVTLEKDAAGSVCAVKTNVAAVNLLAANVLERAVEQTAENVLTVGVPVGNLSGSALLLGKGPSVPVEVVMLSSSVAAFRSELTSAGINQTRHQIILELHVDISLFMPWRTVSSEVDTDILVSETVIVGDVPQSYLNWRSGAE